MITTIHFSLGKEWNWLKHSSLKSSLQSVQRSKYVREHMHAFNSLWLSYYVHTCMQLNNINVNIIIKSQLIILDNLLTQELIKLGAVTLMVPGNLPIGCSASYLTNFKTTNIKDYEAKTGCLNWLNKFSQYHNRMLQQELNSIRKQNPNITIIYADYYNAAISLYRSPKKYGIN